MALNTTAAYAVEESSQVAGPRRAVMQLAERLEFSDSRAGQAAIIVSELATNLTKHATHGEILLRAIRADDHVHGPRGIEIVALDKGPGMPDVALSRQDGHSTAGSLGHGIGAIERQADFLQIYSQPSGSVVVSQLWRERTAAPARLPLYEIGAVHVSHPGEEICGDDWEWRMRDDRLSIVVADGLGHGLSANEAAHAAVEAYARCHEEPPSRVIDEVHAALRGTRGAAVAMVAIDVESAVAKYCGVGNISGMILTPTGTRQSMVSQNGTAGHLAPRIQEFSYPVPAQSLLVLFSDGLTSHPDLAPYPGIRTRHPSVIAAVLYRDFSRRRDDVTVVVAKAR